MCVGAMVLVSRLRCYGRMHIHEILVDAKTCGGSQASDICRDALYTRKLSTF